LLKYHSNQKIKEGGKKKKLLLGKPNERRILPKDGNFSGMSDYSGCQRNVPIAGRFFVTTLMPPSLFRNFNMASGINFNTG
jgi:hypothetical protein